MYEWNDVSGILRLATGFGGLKPTRVLAPVISRKGDVTITSLGRHWIYPHQKGPMCTWPDYDPIRLVIL